MHSINFILLLLTFLFRQIEPLKVRGRIVAGNKAIYGQFPWHVLLRKYSFSKSICGGSIISPEWVLTSSKCLKSSPSVFLMFGSIISNDTNALNMMSSNFYMHSYLNAALIKLPKPLTFNERIQAIDLPSDILKNRNFTGETAEICGFGFSGDAWEDHKTEHLKYTRVKLTANRYCKTWDKSDFLCAKNDKPTGTICDGDMGGAMTWTNEDGRPLQIAIISESPNFCDWPSPLLYVRVTTLLSWIKELTNVNATNLVE